MPLQLLETVEVGPAEADNSVIWLHGLGADGYDFEPLVPELQFAAKQRTRFVFPHAPARPVTINAGMTMRAWYDIIGIDENSPEDEAGIRQAEQGIKALIQHEHRRGVPSERIVLAGFSQGGAMALHCGLRYSESLAGILALSAYLPLRTRLDAEISSAAAAVPILMVHGEADPVVPLSLAMAARDTLQDRGLRLEWRTYPMDHAVIPQEIDDIGEWLAQRLG